MKSHFQMMKSGQLWDERSHLNGKCGPTSTCKRALEIQIFGRSAEHVPSAVADSGKHISISRSLQRWLERYQTKMMEKEKIMKETIIIPMVVTWRSPGQ
jgi:hypothetical protein